MQPRSQGLSSYRLGRARRDRHSSLARGGKLRDPGNEVDLRAACSLFIVNAGVCTFDMPRAFFGFTGGLHN